MSIKVLLIFGGFFGILWYVSSIGGRNSIRKRTVDSLADATMDAVLDPPKEVVRGVVGAAVDTDLFDDVV